MTSSLSPLLIRADANTQIGTGHVMRCLALAQAWQRHGGQAHFVQIDCLSGLESRLLAAGCTVQCLGGITPGGLVDANTTAAAAQARRAKWVVVDGYHFDAAYQRQLKRAGLKLLFVDDFGHCDAYSADLILNQNVYAHKTLYEQRSAGTQLLLGCDYALLRSEFRPWIGWRRHTEAVARRLLVTMGGGDPDNQTWKVLQALANVDISLSVTVLVGAANRHYPNPILKKTVAELNERHEITFLHNTRNMPELIAAADFTVCAGGSTNWEMAFLGLPALILTIADNQRGIANGLHELGVAQRLGWFEKVTAGEITSALNELIVDAQRRQKMSINGQKLVDGLGTDRIVQQLRVC